MKVVAAIARILLGLTFFILGLNGFLHFIPGAPPPGPATTFFTAMVVESHYYVLVFGVQVLCGLLLLAIVALVLWVIVCWSVRSEFVTLLARKPYAGLS